ncbi:MAG: sodium:glutamate symporter [Firmicutes bacterium]|jgi:ESS family glutamate:Na+ symporter|nr:sodium:glutamate symporter [Bacillota bacterium]
MDFSASNQGLWHGVIQLGFLTFAILFGNLLRRKIKIIRLSLLPTSVIGGFIGLFLKSMGWLNLDLSFLEGLTYHMTAIGFIALSLRAPVASENPKGKRGAKDGINSGAFIVSNYLLQGIVGIVTMLLLSFTIYPKLFAASGIILPMGFGQGPGQAFSVGNMYEQTFGFQGGRAFGLAIATMGMLWASIGGIFYLNLFARRSRKTIGHEEQAKQDQIQEPMGDLNEIPLTEAVDKFTIQVAFVLIVYLTTYFSAWGITSFIANTPFLVGIGKSVIPLIWGFNFLIGSSLALLTRRGLSTLQSLNLMKRKYTNNYMLNRISGTAFDLMIAASICAINIEDLKHLLIPFLIMTTIGGIIVLLYNIFMAKIIYPDYFIEGMLSMYGMMTGTVSTGIILLREVDPIFKTPASNNLVIGSSVAIILGFPMLLMVGIAPQSATMLWAVLGACILYFAGLNAFMYRNRPKDLN